MRILFTFISILITLASGASSSSYVPFESITFSPLYATGDTSIEVVTRTSNVGFQFYISNEAVSNMRFITAMFNSAGTHTLTYSNTYTRTTNVILIKYSYNNKWYDLPTKTMKVASSKYINILDDETLTSTGSICTINTSLKWSEKTVTYRFSGFNGLYVPNFYHKLNLSDFKIITSNRTNAYSNCTASLVINNVNGTFGNISTKESVEFPLKVTNSNGSLTLSLNDTYYVNKETLVMYKTQKTGSVATKHIYFPRNQMRIQDKFKAYFIFQNFGLDRNTVRHSFEFKALKNTVGDCRNSQYCIQRIEP